MFGINVATTVVGLDEELKDADDEELPVKPWRSSERRSHKVEFRSLLIRCCISADFIRVFEEVDISFDEFNDVAKLLTGNDLSELARPKVKGSVTQGELMVWRSLQALER